MIHVHVAQGKNTNNAVVSSRKYKGLRGFKDFKNCPPNSGLSSVCHPKIKVDDKTNKRH